MTISKRRYKGQIIFAVGTLTLALAFALSGCSQNDDTATSNSAASKQAEETFAWSETSDCGACHEAAVTSFDNSSCLANKHEALKGSCFTCHAEKKGIEKVHQQVTADSTKKNEKLKKTSIGSEACLSCHKIEEITAATAGSTVLTDKEGAVVNPHALTPSESHDALQCSNCHKTHSTELADQTASAVCKNCHHENVYQCGTCHD